MRRSLAAAVVGLVSIALAGCGSDATTPPPAAPASSTAGTSTAGTSAAAEPAPVAAPGQAVPGIPPLTGKPTDLTTASQAQAGSGPAPTGLLAQDVVVGKGTAATLADTVDVRYSGTLYSDGTLFDSSWSSGDEPVNFPLDAVVPGFAQGIAGMQPGGRRVMVIPPALGYGNRATGPIPPGSTLVFVVDLVAVK
ncbi:MAG: FKBP-type peptidyl-prolyl cis-trans isomerase [Pseudonocardia sp.]